jgi:hypothetical protein
MAFGAVIKQDDTMFFGAVILARRFPEPHWI